MTPRTRPWAQRLPLVVALLVCAVLAWIPRDVDGLRRPDQPAGIESEGWFSTDPDGLYHTRRVERGLQQGLPTAGVDPYLDYPHGSRIPWPPYYDSLLALAIEPLAPEGSDDGAYTARRAFIERAVGTVPIWFGLLTVALAAGMAWRVSRGSPTVVRTSAALAAGGTLALCRVSINYSVIGNGDHHAWVALLHGALLLVTAAACCRGNLGRPGRSALFGVGAGLLAALMLGSWVASLLYVINIQLVLAWLLFRRARDELPGVATFGLAFHLTAAAAILPATLWSPWREEFPWMVVNLSWFHPAQLLVGALVFVPPLVWRRSLASGSVGARRYPWLVAAALLAGAALLWVTGSSPARGVAEGFAWVSRADAFMAAVFESQPLVGARSGGSGQLFEALGYGVLLLPVAYAPLAWKAFARRHDVLVPVAVALPPLLVQALNQRRFADVLAFVMAVCLGWAAGRLVARLAGDGPGPAARALWPAAALAAALLLQWPAVSWTARVHSRSAEQDGTSDYLLGDRMAYEWIRTQYPAPDRDPELPWAVLAHWDRGHAIEWAADRPTVATNFGTYVGEDSYRDPARFFLSEDPLAARALLQERRVRYVFVPGSIPGDVPAFVRIADPSLSSKYLTLRNGVPGYSPRWFSTVSARLVNGGIQVAQAGTPLEARGSPLGFLRLVYVSPIAHPGYHLPDGKPMPANFVWEHVPGATIAARGLPGELVRADLAIRYRRSERQFPAARGDYRLELTFVARCDTTGIARLWIPYSTEVPNGEGVVDSARWSIGERSGPLVIPEAAVQGGAPIRIP